MKEVTEREGFCPGCGLLATHCVCAELPRLSLPFRFLILQHVSERFRQSNTGRILHLMLEDSVLLCHGRRDPPLDPREILEGETWILYPTEDALLLGEVRPPRGSRLLVLDGSWRQVRRMLRRIPALQGLPRLKLPPGPLPRSRARRSPGPGRFSTLDSVIRVAEVLGFPVEGKLMLETLELVDRRLLAQRGRAVAR